jgi:hypothetical protein
MKRHSGWLAAGLLLLVVLACNLSKNGNNNNSNDSNNSNSNKNKNSNTATINRPANADVFIEKIHMAKDDSGKPGESSTTFAPDEHTVHCVIDLNKAKGGTTVKFTWVAVDVEGLAKNDELKSIDYTTRSFENNIHAHLTLPKDWPKGTYKVDVYINGALDKTIDYTVE